MHVVMCGYVLVSKEGGPQNRHPYTIINLLWVEGAHHCRPVGVGRGPGADLKVPNVLRPDALANFHIRCVLKEGHAHFLF